MLPKLCFSLLLVVLADEVGRAQEWARKMFDHTSHDFGFVAHGAKVEHRFTFKNLYEEDIHISSVRSSCGCTTPTVTKNDLKTFETAEVLATFNTRTFLGYRSATLTVVIDRPFNAEVQLQVSGNIRGDVVVHPGFVDLGSVDVGTAVEKKVAVLHAGKPDWQIVNVRSANPNFEVKVFETKREASEVSYDLVVRLKPDAPAGYLKEQLFLVTNDARAPQFPVDVEGRIVAGLTVSPASLSFGTLRPGQKVTKNIVVRGKSPFKILDIECTSEAFGFSKPEAARKIHLIAVTFTAGDTPGKASARIRVHTDAGQTAPELTAHAQVADAVADEDAAATD